MKAQPKIAVVYGGPSQEVAVSQLSAEEVTKALRTCYAEVYQYQLSPQLADELIKNKIDVVFPATHGCPGEDGTLQGFLEILGLPYVGCSVLASACSMDKITAKQLFRLMDLPVAPDRVIYAQEGAQAAAQKTYQRLAGRVVVKPVLGGSALNTQFCDNVAELTQTLTTTFAQETRVLIEQYVAGKEITIGLLETDDELIALPVVEIRTPPGTWYDYDHRYTPGWSEHIIPAPLTDTQYQQAQTIAKDAFRVLQCRDFARADFVVPEAGEPILLEMNTIPGMTPTSLYPDAAKAAGWAFPDLLSYLVERAWRRKNVYALCP